MMMSNLQFEELENTLSGWVDSTAEQLEIDIEDLPEPMRIIYILYRWSTFKHSFRVFFYDHRKDINKGLLALEQRRGMVKCNTPHEVISLLRTFDTDLYGVMLAIFPNDAQFAVDVAIGVEP